MIRPNSQQETVDLVTFTEESFYGKPQFLHRFYSGYNTLDMPNNEIICDIPDIRMCLLWMKLFPCGQT